MPKDRFKKSTRKDRLHKDKQSKMEESRLITKTLSAKSTRMNRAGARDKAMRYAVERLNRAGYLFDKGHVLLIVKALKCVIAFDIPETKTEARKYAENEGLDFFHVINEMYRDKRFLENVMDRILAGRGREIFIGTPEQKDILNADQKLKKEIHSKTGGRICSKNIPLVPGQRV